MAMRKVRIYLLSGISASGDDGNTADLEDCRDDTKSALPSSFHLSTSWDHSHFMSTGVGFVCRGVVLVQVESIFFRNVRVLSEFVNHVQVKSQLGRYRVWPSVKFSCTQRCDLP